MLPEDTLYPSVEEVQQIFNYRCPKCRRASYTVHELEPRARGKYTLLMQNRTAICFECHDNFHGKGASMEQIHEWQDYIKSYLKSIGRWEEYLGWGSHG